MRKAKNIQNARNPFERGRAVLSEGYGEFLGTSNFMDALRFEMLRSVVVQRLYEINDRDDWLDVAKVDEEIKTAKRERRRFCSNAGIAEFMRRYPLDDEITRDLLSLGRKANSYSRFLGSVRQHVPGVGYAISVKKKHGPNQDSFLVQDGMLAVADGTGSEKFSAMASHLVMLRIRERKEELQKQPGATIHSISREVGDMMSVGGRLSVMSNEILGSTTLSVALLEGNRNSIYIIGDSLAFLKLDHDGKPVIEQIGRTKMPYWVLGHAYKLGDKPIEHFERIGKPLILTTDGITQRVKRTNLALERFFTSMTESVRVAERIIRLALRNSMRTGMTDDMTIVIQE